MKRKPKSGWHNVSDAEIAAHMHAMQMPRPLTPEEAKAEAEAWAKIAAAQPPTEKDQIRAAQRRKELEAFGKEGR